MAMHPVSMTFDKENGQPQAVSETYPTPIIDTPHLRTHQGKFFNCHYLIPHGGELANDATLDILFITGAKEPHSLPMWNVGGSCEAHIFENTVVSANGTALDIYNHARWSSTAALSSAFLAPTITSDGTELGDGLYIPGGGGPKASGGQVSFSVEFDMKSNTKYLYRLINRSGSAIMGEFSIPFYEN